MTKLRKLLACLMIACMALSLMPLAAFATEGEPVETIACEQHSFANGVCTECGYVCQHENVAEGVCAECGMTVMQEPADTQDGNATEGGNETPANDGGNSTSQTGEDGNGELENIDTAVAAIGETEYMSLAEALNAMQAGSVVTLLGDVAEDVVFKTSGTVELGDFGITGTVTVQADVTLVGGSVNQGNTGSAAIVINSGSLTLDDTLVSGDNGISVETTKEVSIIVGGTIHAEKGYGICQIEVDPKEKGTLNVTCTEDALIEAETVGVEIINGAFISESKAEGIDCAEQTALKIDAGSYSICDGEFDGAFSFGKDVTGSIIGGEYTNDPTELLKNEYIAVVLEGLYNVVQGTKAGEAYVYAGTVNENGSDVSAAEGITVEAVPAKTEGAGSAISKEAVLGTITGLKTGDSVEINVSLKAEVKEAKVDADGKVSSATYSLTPEIGLSVNGAAEQAVTYDAALLNGSEITVTVPLVSGFVPEEIVHIHADGSEDTYKKGTAASVTEFVVNADGTVSFKVTSFSDFVMNAQAAVAEVYKADGSLKAKCYSDEEILSNLEDGCTVKLLDDLTGASLRVVDLKNGSATLDLAGHKISGADGTYTIDIVGGNLTITDSSAEGTGEISGAPAVKVGLNATVTLESGTLSGTGYGVEVNGVKAKFIMNGGAVSGTDKAVYIELGSAEINDGKIDGVSEDVGVKSVALEDAKANIYGGSFKHEVPEVQCADGYVPCADAKNPGRYSVEPITDPVASAQDALGVDQGTFATVQDAVNAAGIGGKVTLLRNSGDYATVSRAITIDGAGYKMKNLTVMSTVGAKVMNLKADTLTVSANAKAELSGENEIGSLVNNGALCEITDGKYLSHTGSGTYSISGGVFGDAVTQDQCALVPVTGKITGTAASLTKYTPALNTDPETKDEYPYTVEVAPDPSITGISNNAYFQKYSSGTLTIYTDGDYDELVKSGSNYRCLHVYNANGTDLISSRYYTVAEDENGYAVITISNAFLRNRPTGTYSVQVDFTTGVTQMEDFRVGTSSTPKTGDESNIGLWIGIMACSAIIIGCGAFVLIRKNKKNKK